ncbi:MAG: VWA domain-containing protein [Planctomycetota bacterium]
MLTVASPGYLLLLVLPAILYWLLPAYRPAKAGVAVPFLDRLARLTGQTPTSGSAPQKAHWIQRFVLLACWGLTVLALARPQRLEAPISRQIPTRDLLLAVDLSGSMETKDFTDSHGKRVDRLTAVKEVLHDFLTRRKGDRVGLIFFGSSAFVQTPFTEDLEACRTLLDEAQVRMAGPKTSLGDAIGLALTLFEHDQAVQDRVLIVLTDGNDTGSQIPPDRAAQIAHDRQITIHAVAVGDPTAAGEDKLDEKTLQNIAKVTGGRYSHAADRGALARIYTDLDALRTRPVETVTHRPRTDLFFWPLGAAALCSLFYHLLMIWHTGAWKILHSVRRSPTLALALPMVPLLGDAVDFHFLRPEWLSLLIPLGAVCWLMWQTMDSTQAWKRLIDPELLTHLIVGQDQKQYWKPAVSYTVVSLFAVIAVAGPTWQREPSPFSDDRAVLAIVVKVTPTMLAQDIQPSRLTRAAQKISDLLQLRRGTRSALIAYSGSAHLVLPLTSDTSLLSRFASELSPDIMPLDGDAPVEALKIAGDLLRKANAPGSILWIADEVPATNAAALTNFRRESEIPVQILAVAGDASSPVPGDSPPAPPLDRSSFSSIAKAVGGTLVEVTPDAADINSLVRHTVVRLSSTEKDQIGERWQDAGYWLSFLVALGMLSWFRSGWFVYWEAVRS